MKRKNSPIECPSCGADLLLDSVATSLDSVALAPCPACGKKVAVKLYPAALRAVLQPDPIVREEATSEESSRCYYHHESAGAAICELCGRILCTLCKISYGPKVYCAACIESTTTKGEDPEFIARRFRYDDLAASIAIYPLLTCIFWFATILTAPLAIFLSIRHWNTKLSAAPYNRTRFYLAITIALLEIAGWASLIGVLIWS